MATRLTRDDRKARTREELVATARRVFLRRGFHRASLDEIAAEAGYTKGAVYSNFAGKDELFLAVVDDHYGRRVDAYAGFLFDQPTAEEAYRAVARFMIEGDERDPGWTPLLSEFMVHASRHEALRRQVVESRERFLDAIAGLIEGLCAKHGVEFRLPAKDVARGSGAIARGLFVERLISPGSVSPELFEEVHVAYMRGLAVPTHERSTR